MPDAQAHEPMHSASEAEAARSVALEERNPGMSPPVKDEAQRMRETLLWIAAELRAQRIAAAEASAP